MTAFEDPRPGSGLAMARSIESVVLDNAAASETDRTLNEPIVQALWESGLMTWMNPAEAGGRDPSMEDLLDTWLELARQDGSTGWIGIANLPSAAFAAAYLGDAAFAEIFTAHNNHVTMAGQFAPNGLGEQVEGGFRVTGNYSFGSGTGHSQYVVGGFIPTVNGEMDFGDDGMPDMRVAIFPAEQVNFTDNWHVQGLKGTGSYDYNVQDQFVPAHMTYPLFCRDRQRGSELFRVGLMPLVAAGHAAWALGVARSMLDDVSELAQNRTRMGDPTNLAQKPTFQRGLAHHEGMWRAARANVYQTYLDMERRALASEDCTLKMRADMRIAATYATEACREVCQWAHLAAGTTSIREGSRLERAFRDMYTGTQHAFISEKTYLDAAQVLLGLSDNVPGL